MREKKGYFGVKLIIVDFSKERFSFVPDDYPVSSEQSSLVWVRSMTDVGLI